MTSEDVRVTPVAWTARGEARVPGHHRPDLFVFGGIPGEPGDVWVQHVGMNQALGLWRYSGDPDPHRVEPPCERYSACGGCPLMHLDTDGQWLARESLIRGALDHEGLGAVRLGGRHASPDGLEGFRHVAKVGAGYSDQGRVRLGAWGRRSRTIVPIPKCNVATETVRRVMSSLAHHVIEQGIRPYDVERDSGVLRSAVVRQSRTTGEVLLTLIVGRRVRELVDLAEALANDCTEVAGVWMHVNDETGNNIFSRDGDGAIGVRPLVGKDSIEETLDGITYRIGPGDFFQTNPAMAEELYRHALDALQVEQGTPFIDLYCGVGGVALQAARRAGWALGIEEVEGAVGRAREAARHNDVTAEFIAGRVLDVIPDVARRMADRRPVVSVNPARRGLEDGVIDGIVALRPRRIGYISCNPRALARDLRLFAEQGYEIGDVEMFDMFPNTAHVETFVVLTSRDTEGLDRRAPQRRVVRR